MLICPQEAPSNQVQQGESHSSSDGHRCSGRASDQVCTLKTPLEPNRALIQLVRTALTCSFHLGGLFLMMTIFSSSSFFRNFSRRACTTTARSAPPPRSQARGSPGVRVVKRFSIEETLMEHRSTASEEVVRKARRTACKQAVLACKETFNSIKSAKPLSSDLIFPFHIGLEGAPLPVRFQPGYDTCHFAWPPRSQDVVLVGHAAQHLALAELARTTAADRQGL